MLFRTLIVIALMGLSVSAEEQVRTVAGNGSRVRSGDGGPAVEAGLGGPFGVTTGPDGALYVCEVDNHCVRRIDLKSGQISTVAGNGTKGWSGDGGPATKAACNEPYEVRFGADGAMYFVEMQNHLVRKVDARTGVISTLAGSGTAGFSGDDGPAVKAQLRNPHSIALRTLKGQPPELFIADIGNHRVRRVDLTTGIISTWSGNGMKQATPDETPVSGAPLNGPRAIDFQGPQMWLALREGNAVLRVNDHDQWVRIAGNGKSGYTGHGGPARDALLSGPKGIALDRDGNVYLADTESHTIRRILAKDLTIHTVVGDGQKGDGPDGPPLKCRLDRPHGVYVSPDGLLFIGDSSNNRVRMLRVHPAAR